MVSNSLFQTGRFHISLLSHESCIVLTENTSLYLCSWAFFLLSYTIPRKKKKAFMFFKDRAGFQCSRVTEADWGTPAVSTMTPSLLLPPSSHPSFSYIPCFTLKVCSLVYLSPMERCRNSISPSCSLEHQSSLSVHPTAADSFLPAD